MADNPQTIGVMMIVQGNDQKIAPKLQAALGSISGYVDYIGIQLNAPKGKKIHPEIRKIAEVYGDLVYDYEWTGNFVTARNHLMEKMPKSLDWLGFMDHDDTWFNPELIQPIVNKTALNVHGIYLLYDYDHDEFGNVVTQHWVTRLVRNDGSFRWKSSIDDDEVSVHETLVATRNVESYGEGAMKIIHHTDAQHSIDSLQRNVELLREMYKRQQKKGKVDPRILYYLATHLYDYGEFNACMDLLIEYLQFSGWNEERSMAHLYIGMILKHSRGEIIKARTAYLMAIGEDPNNENAWLELARLEFEDKRYTEAVSFLHIGTGIKREITPLVKFNNQWQMYALMAECLVNIGGTRIDEAHKWIQKALDKRPFDKEIQLAREKIVFLQKQRDDMRATTRLLRKLEDGEQDKVLPFLDNLPKDLRDSQPVVAAHLRHDKPAKWLGNSIVFYVGDSSLGQWGPWSLNETGIGGSEEAVIRMTQGLVKKGWNITVFGTPGNKAGLIDGVTWKQYWEINPNDEYNILISWRQPAFFDVPWKARKKYLWLHDVMPEGDFTKERIKHIDKVIFVSDYHAGRPEFSLVPKRKKFISGNGIVSNDFKRLTAQPPKRNPNRLIYTSANERGLRILYDIWPDIKKAVPKATLDSYYGWESFDAINRTNPERMAWKASMLLKVKKLDGVTMHGRISQDKLNEELFKSGIWAYPSFFPEVSCISAMKAQASGAMPVTSNFANLKNVVFYGEQVDMGKFEEPDIEHYKKRLIAALLYPEK